MSPTEYGMPVIAGARCMIEGGGIVEATKREPVPFDPRHGTEVAPLMVWNCGQPATWVFPDIPGATTVLAQWRVGGDKVPIQMSGKFHASA